MFAIVGRGIVGLTIAYRMARLGLPVVVCGQRNTYGSASYAALGLANNKGLIWPRSSLFKAKFDGHKRLWDLMIELETDFGLGVSRFQGNIFEPYVSPEQFREIKRRIYGKMFTGCFLADLSSEKLNDLAQIVPRLAAEPLGALRYPLDYWFDAPGLLAALETALERLGVATCESNLRDISGSPDGGQVLRFEDDTTLRVSESLLALGPFLAHFLEKHFGHRLPLEARPGGHWCWDGPATHQEEAAVLAGKIRLVKVKSLLFLGSTDSGSSQGPDQWRADEADHDAMFPQVLRSLSTVYPQGGSLHRQEATFRFGVRSRAPGQVPLVGPLVFSPRFRFWIAGGLGKSGFLLASEIADSFARRFVGLHETGPLLETPLLTWARRPS